MPITAKCSCGKRMTVSDSLANRNVRCSNCGNEVYVSAPSPSGGNSGAKPVAKKKAAASPAVYMSSGMVIAIVVVGLLVAGSLMFYFGPMRVTRQWDAMADKANGDVTDVITFALQAYQSQEMTYDPGSSRGGPRVDDVRFHAPVMVMSMPDKIVFKGATNEGTFDGTYAPQTGEIEANIEVGGMAVAGMVRITRPTELIHVTGRDTNGTPTAEKDGTPLTIVSRPKLNDQ